MTTTAIIIIIIIIILWSEAFHRMDTQGLNIYFMTVHQFIAVNIAIRKYLTEVITW
jgi:hypothetical protein